MQETQVQSLGQEDPLKKATHFGILSILAWKNPMERGALWARVHGVAKVRDKLATKQQQQKS